ncbi:hypothetical protein FSW04_13950 [Baekduia soli]|uniref:SPW repeat-containing protein n=1 Tax=Baekduia soli TaxID=496014 RepID=A0A5B8U7B0_9ACTN|nr:hypothetical protein [Baekduia soli]QEC48562.1 hypothetical protein FSW04_13950 [Baekduia soli]
MRLHFVSRLALLVAGGFLAVASQVWTGDTLQWMFVGGGGAMIIGAAMDAIRSDLPQRALDGLIGVLGAWTVIEAFSFEASDLKWWSLASACALVGLAGLGLILHEMRTERVVHELSVTPSPERPLAGVDR